MRDGHPRAGRLLVLVSERISEWIGKGEVIDRYYNPGDLFAELDLALTNDDVPDARALQRMAGRARITVHNLPPPPRLFVRTLGLRPMLLRGWAHGAVELARQLRPDVVRCYGAGINAFAAREIQRTLGTPYAVSLHNNPDVDVRGRSVGARERLATKASGTLERVVLRDADLVLPVYRPIVPYLERIGVQRYEVAYNVVNDVHITPKSDYRSHSPVRVVSVGRHIDAKLPDRLMRAVAALDGVHLTLVGQGPRHDDLRALAVRLGPERFAFEPALANDELCARLPTFDIFATRSDYYELSKAVLEALLTGLPVVVNERPGEPVPELAEAGCLLVGNTTEDYRAALQRLISDDGLRERTGRGAREAAVHRWSPSITEAHMSDLYCRLIEESGVNQT
jgi:glycosyltransferase involved in cell wall biosynthesis